jgi:hypothetical protein
MVKKIGKSAILKNLRAKDLKGGVEEKRTLAREAGSRGLSTLQADKYLKEEMGYDPKRRKKIMSQITGGDKKIEKSDLINLTKKELESKYGKGLAHTELEKERVRKRVNIYLGRESAGEVKGYIAAKGGLGIAGQRGNKRVKETSEGLGIKRKKNVYAAGLNKDESETDSPPKTGFAIQPGESTTESAGINKPPVSPINKTPSPPPAPSPPPGISLSK